MSFDKYLIVSSSFSSGAEFSALLMMFSSLIFSVSALFKFFSSPLSEQEQIENNITSINRQ